MTSLFELVINRLRPVSGPVTKLFILSVDMAFALFSFITALLITSNFDGADTTKYLFSAGPVVLLTYRALAFYFFRTYFIIVRYVGEQDFKNVVYAIGASSVAFYISVKLFPVIMPTAELFTVVFVDMLALLALSGGLRFLTRLLFDRMRLQGTSSINTVIFGAGEMGNLVYRVLKQDKTHNYRVVAFFDDNPMIHQKMLNGIQVFNPENSFDDVVARRDVKVAIVAIMDLPDERRIAFIEKCLKRQIKVLKLPPTASWLNGNLQLTQLSNINFEDLLNRPAIRLDEDAIGRSVRNRVVLVSGCAGSIGSEIVRQLLKYEPARIIGIDQAETPLAEIGLELENYLRTGIFETIISDVRDYDKLYRIFQEYQPDYVFHAAAYKHVPMMERFPEEAIKVNVLGTQHLARLASEFGVRKFVMVSTDKVVNPGNVMGASKRIAEIYVQSLNYAPDNHTQFITTRFGNVLGSNGSVIPIFRQQIEKRQPLTVTHPEVTRYFMTIPEACQLVLEAGVMGKGGEIFVFDMGQPVRIIDLAKKMIQMAGLVPDKDIPILFTGLRPGEKLTEELFDEAEATIPTHHEKIRRARVRHYEYEAIRQQVDQLVHFAHLGVSDIELVRMMKELVPEFASKNSAFSVLDGGRETTKAVRYTKDHSGREE